MGAINWLKPSNRKPFKLVGGQICYSYFRPASVMAEQLKRREAKNCKAFGQLLQLLHLLYTIIE